MPRIRTRLWTDHPPCLASRGAPRPSFSMACGMERGISASGNLTALPDQPGRREHGQTKVMYLHAALSTRAPPHCTCNSIILALTALCIEAIKAAGCSSRARLLKTSDTSATTSNERGTLFSGSLDYYLALLAETSSVFLCPNAPLFSRTSLLLPALVRSPHHSFSAWTACRVSWTSQIRETSNP